MLSRLESGPAPGHGSWKDRDFLLANVAVMVAIAAMLLFPAQPSSLRAMTLQTFLFTIFPILSVRFIIRRPLPSFGLGPGSFFHGLMAALLALVVFSVFIVLAFRYFSISFENVLPRDVFSGFFPFLAYFISLSVVLLNTEVLFRGVLLFSWRRVIGAWAIVAQVFALLLSVLLGGYLGGRIPHVSIFILYGVWAALAGSVAYLSRSIAYSFLFSVLSGILMAVIVLVMNP